MAKIRNLKNLDRKGLKRVIYEMVKIYELDAKEINKIIKKSRY